MTCPGCESDYGLHYSMRFCPHCGIELWPKAHAESLANCQKTDEERNTGIDVVNVLVNPEMPEGVVTFRDARSGDEVTLKHVGEERDYYTRAEVDVEGLQWDNFAALGGTPCTTSAAGSCPDVTDWGTGPPS